MKKKCIKCGEVKNLHEFKKQKQHSDGYCSWCKKCHCKDTLRSVDRIKANRNNRRYKKTEKGRIAGRKYKAQRRARIYGNRIELTNKEHKEIRKLYMEAKQMRENGINAEVDHVIPLSKGGLHCLGNLQIISAEENRRKGCQLI